MNIEDHIQFWLDGADHDLDVAESLFSAGKYDWCLFLAQLVIEKALKAVYVRDNNNQLPPRTHNLVRLAETTHLQFDNEQKEFLSEITDYNLEVRYPTYARDFYKQCTEAFAAKKFDDIKEIYRWITSRIQSEKS
jgi:HEPN domain-containing protein